MDLTDITAYDRMVEFFIKFVEAHQANGDVLERETSNILAAVQIVFEREMHPAGLSVFGHFIKTLRRTRAI
jgi:hypothetical protein